MTSGVERTTVSSTIDKIVLIKIENERLANTSRSQSTVAGASLSSTSALITFQPNS